MISNNFRKLILLISLIGFTTSMMSQRLVTSIDSTSIFIGEEITYKLEIHSDTLAQIKFPESESFVPMEVLKTLLSSMVCSCVGLESVGVISDSSCGIELLGSDNNIFS